MGMLGSGTDKPLDEYMQQVQQELDQTASTHGQRVATGGVLWNNGLVDVGIVHCDSPTSIEAQVNQIGRQLHMVISGAETVNEVSRPDSVPDIIAKCNGPALS